MDEFRHPDTPHQAICVAVISYLMTIDWYSRRLLTQGGVAKHHETGMLQFRQRLLADNNQKRTACLWRCENRMQNWLGSQMAA